MRLLDWAGSYVAIRNARSHVTPRAKGILTGTLEDNTAEAVLLLTWESMADG